MLMIDEDEVLVPTKTAFTGSDSIENFSKRFTRDIPYCLRYIPTRRSEPVGMRFAQPIARQTKRVKGKLQEVAQSGEAQLMSVKRERFSASRKESRNSPTPAGICATSTARGSSPSPSPMKCAPPTSAF